MEEKHNDIEQVEEEQTTIEKPKKRNYVMTEARRLAFERCQQARREQVKNIQKGKKIKSLITKEDKIKQQKEALLEPVQSDPVQVAVQPIEEQTPTIEKPKRMRQKPIGEAPKPRRKKDVIEQPQEYIRQSPPEELFHVFI